MKPHQETYQGRQIEITEEGKLEINKKEIDYMYDPAVEKYITRYLPYSQYETLAEMARVIAATSPDFVDTTK